MDFMLGSDYENIRPLDAKGGMGDLFRAHKKGLDVEVVIKRIKRAKDVKEMLSDMVEKERDEKRIAAREFMGYGDMDDSDNIN